MRLSDSQEQQLRSHYLAAFLQHFEDFAMQHVGHRPARSLSHALFERGRHYGLLSEQDLVGYMLLAWGAGAHPPEPDPAWILELMTDPHRTAEDKLRALFDLADQGAGRQT